jgi:hypothetical protein
MRRILAVFAVLLFLPIFGMADTVEENQQVLASKYDLDSTSYVYCKMSDWQQGIGRIETSGSSATVTAVTGSSGPFDSLAVGDEVTVDSPLLVAPVTFTIIARASGTSVTADQAINIDVAGGSAFRWRDLSCGDTAADGWVRLPAGQSTVVVTFRRGDLTGGVTFDVEGRNRGSNGVPSQLATGVLATASATLSTNNTLILGETFEQYRVGLKVTTADPSDTTTNLEQVDVIITTIRK